MDEFVRQKLKYWNLEVLLEIFRENAIDEEVFNALEESLIKDLIPQVGYRFKFLRKYKEYLTTIAGDNAHNQSTQDSEAHSSNRRELETNNHDNTVDSEASTLQSVLSSTSRSSQDPYASFDSFVDSRKPTLLQKLNNTTKGKEILAGFKSTKTLKRSKLADFIIENETNVNPDTRISRQRFKDLAEEIAASFPGERAETYYIPWTKSVHGSVSARGILYDRYSNRRRVFRQIGLLSNAKSSTTSIPDQENEEEVDRAIEWLKNNLEPINEVQDKWKLTCKKRQILSQHLEISEYYQIYKCLRSPIGYALLDSDFEIMHEGCSDKLFTEWPVLAKHIITIASRRRERLIKDYLTKYSDLVTSGTVDILALMLLPLLLGTVCVKNTRGQGHWRPSKIEVQQSFILHVETIDEVQPILEEKIKKYMKYKLTNQPSPIICGPLNNIASSILQVDDIRYALPSPLKAVDSCFKSMFALRAQYPIECNHVYNFLERHVYGIKSPSSKNYVAVNTLVSEINASRKLENGML